MTLHKKQDNFRYVFIYQNPALCVKRFFIEFLKFAEGGGIFIFLQKNHFALHFYIQKQCTLRYIAIYKELDTMRYILINK